MRVHAFREEGRRMVAVVVGRFWALAFRSHTIRPYAGRVGHGFEVSVLGFALRIGGVQARGLMRALCFSCGCPLAGGPNVYGIECR